MFHKIRGISLYSEELYCSYNSCRTNEGEAEEFAVYGAEMSNIWKALHFEPDLSS